MEYCNGGDLSKFMKKNRNINEDLIKKFLLDLSKFIFKNSSWIKIFERNGINSSRFETTKHID
jgi:serine/threonine protein kinase